MIEDLYNVKDKVVLDYASGNGEICLRFQPWIFNWSTLTKETENTMTNIPPIQAIVVLSIILVLELTLGKA